MLDRIGELRQIAKRRVNVGCGNIPLAGAINVDIANDAADIKADARSLPFPDSSMHFLESHHCLEHFTRKESDEVLREWARVLIPGGLLFITVPDLPAAFDIILQRLDVPEMWQGFMGSVYGIQNDDYDIHKWGYSIPYLQWLLSQIGFESEGFVWPYRPTPTLGVLAKKL